MDRNTFLAKLELPAEVADLLRGAPALTVASRPGDLVELAVRDAKDGCHVVAYDVPGKGLVEEARVCKAKNGVVANYFDPYMRRRDPDSMLIGDDGPTDKVPYAQVHGKPFAGLRGETLAWLKGQPLCAFIFMAGQIAEGVPSLVIAPDNAGFFALGMAKLQGLIDPATIEGTFAPKCFVFVAPPFRHTHFAGKQVVVHNRLVDGYEVFSYNLYPGPSAKKGIYGALLHWGEREGWLTAHAAVVQVITPYDNRVTIMHEGASGGGKSEMNEHVHREFDGSIPFGTHVETGEKLHIVLPRGCDLHPVTDDMALCHPAIQRGNGKLTVTDAEHGWFIRVDHIKNYGTDPDIEARSIHPTKPLLFLNIDAQPGGTALLWEHIEDAPGKPCPNPRFILPRAIVPDVVSKPVSVDIRSFGVRTPPCTRETPTYGILGLFHVLPPAVAWLWRLVSPRGTNNPSIVDQGGGIGSEGVGSFWPFATGKKVRLANLLLDQVVTHTRTHYVLCPIGHIGAWKVGFTPQWVMREYLARRGGVRFTREELSKSRSSLLGYTLNRLVVEGQHFDPGFLKPYKQAEMGTEAYDAGARELDAFFREELQQYMTDDLAPLGRKIIECFLAGGTVEQYEALVESESIFLED